MWNCVFNKIFGGYGFTNRGPAKLVFPEMLNGDKNVVSFANNIFSETFKDDKCVVTFDMWCFFKFSKVINML